MYQISPKAIFKKPILIALGIGAYAALLVFFIELMSRSDLQETLTWPVQTGWGILLVNWLIALSVCAVMIGLSGRLFLGLSAASLLLILTALANSIKLKWLSQPLFPWDLTLFSEVLDIWTVIWRELIRPQYIVVFLLSLLGLWLLLKFLPRKKINLIARIILTVLALLILSVPCFYRFWSAAGLLERLNISNKRWAQKSNYSTNGLLLAFALNVEGNFVSQPAGYSREAVLAITADLEKETYNSALRPENPSAGFHNPSSKSQRKTSPLPHIIMVLSESFWDPTLLPGLSFDPDPLPCFHALQQEHTSGFMLSPTFGGTTCNVEFEILTGLTMAFLPDGAMPYQQYIHRPLPSLAGVLKEAGYRTIAVQPFHQHFFNSEAVYKNLGFDRYFYLDHFVDPEYRGPFVADREVSKAVVNLVEESSSPAFIFALTMQNHGSYHGKRYEETEVKISGELSPPNLEALKTYTQGVKDADESLKMLVAHFQKTSRPVMILFFGDHLPYFGPNLAVYRDTGFVSRKINRMIELPLADYKKLMSPPLLLWTNFADDKAEIDTVSAFFLGHLVIERAGLNHWFFGNFLGRLSQELFGLGKNLQIDAQGELHRKDLDEYQGVINQYRLLQYDILFGKKYALAAESPAQDRP